MRARALKLSAVASPVSQSASASRFPMSGPKAMYPSANVSATTKSVDLTIQTVAAVGPPGGGVRCKTTIGRGGPLYRLEVPRR
jgi:hypothetical protein